MLLLPLLLLLLHRHSSTSSSTSSSFSLSSFFFIIIQHRLLILMICVYLIMLLSFITFFSFFLFSVLFFSLLFFVVLSFCFACIYFMHFFLYAFCLVSCSLFWGGLPILGLSFVLLVVLTPKIVPSFYPFLIQSFSFACVFFCSSLFFVLFGFWFCCVLFSQWKKHHIQIQPTPPPQLCTPIIGTNIKEPKKGCQQHSFHTTRRFSKSNHQS